MTGFAAAELSQIPMSPALAAALAKASDGAGATGAVEVSIEHLLIALCDDPDAAGVLDASHVDIYRLKSEAIDFLMRSVRPGGPTGQILAVSQPLRRILEAAAAAARGGKRRDINGAIVLAAIVGDGKSAAAQMLQSQGLTFDEAIRALQSALSQPGRGDAGAGSGAAADDVLARARERVQSRSAPSLRDIMKDLPRPAPPPPAPPPVSAPAFPAPGSPAAPPHLDQRAAKPAQTNEHDLDGELPEESARMVPKGPSARQPAPVPAPAMPDLREPAPEQVTSRPRENPASPQPAPSPLPANLDRKVFDPLQPKIAALPKSEPQSHERAQMDTRSQVPTQAQPIPAQQSVQPDDDDAQLSSGNVMFSIREVHRATDPRGDYVYPTGQPMPRPAPPAPVLPVPEPPRQVALDIGGSRPSMPPPMPPPIPRGGGNAQGPGAPALQRSPLPAPSIGPAGPPLGASPVPSAQTPARSRREAPAKAEIGQLAENIPRAMRAGVGERVEVRIAKAHVERLTDGMDGNNSGSTHRVTITSAMSVRLRAPEGGFFIETASPETQWIENQLGIMGGDDYASWRFLVTPQKRGWSKLQIIVSARTIGPDGLAAETALPDQVIEVKVRTNFKRVFFRWSGWIIAAVAGGALAKFGEGAFATGLGLAQEWMQKYLN